MRSQNRKDKFVGRASCLGLLALGLALVNPVVSSSAFAEEASENEASEEVASNDISLQADTPSTVGISFSPAKYYAELSPTDNAGQSARIDLQTTIYVYNSGGYSVYLKSDNPNLVGEKDSSNFIPGATVAKAYTDMDVNTWGYAWKVDAEAVANDATYKALTISGNGDKLAENTDDDIETDTKTIALSFATKINNEMPADTYSNTMMLSVVSSPRDVVKFPSTLVNMQGMTTLICANAPVGATKQLKDVRDGKFYWVSKLADGKCWMTQNLDLDLTEGVKLAADTSDAPEDGYAPNFTTATTATNSTANASNTGQNSWSLGDYYIVYPNDATSCGTKIGDTGTALSACKAKKTSGTPNMFAALSTPTSADGDLNAHYLLGNYYQWDVVTAGTGGSITSGTATNSICPKGWRIPTSGTGGEFQTLMNAYGVTDGTATTGDTAKFVGAPLYFVRAGNVDQDTRYLFNNAGNVGSYWSSTSDSADSNAYNLSLYGVTTVDPSLSSARRYGQSVRCVAR